MAERRGKVPKNLQGESKQNELMFDQLSRKQMLLLFRKEGIKTSQASIQSAIEKVLETQQTPDKQETGLYGQSFVDEVRTLLKEQAVQREKELPPSGWLTIWGIKNLSKEKGLAVDYETVKKVVEVAIVAYPDKEKVLVKEYLSRGNKISPHYAPEIVTSSIEVLQSRERNKQPSDWFNVQQVYDQLKASKVTTSRAAIKATIADELVMNPDKKDMWVKKFWNPDAGEETNHYHEDLVTKVVERLQSDDIKRAPVGWKTNRAIAGILQEKGIGVSPGTVQTQIDAELVANPEQAKKWMNKEYLDVRNRPGVHYHPEFVARVINYFQEREKKKAPTGWMTNFGILELAGQRGVLTTITAVDNAIDTELRANSDKAKEWINDEYLLEKIYRPVKHYHPELVEKVIDLLKLREGWKTTGTIHSLLREAGISVAYASVQDVIDNELKANPKETKDLVNEYLGIGDESRIHYHPELVARVIQHFNKREQIKPPPEWKNQKNILTLLLSQGVRVGGETISLVIKDILDENPDKKDIWVKKFWNLYAGAETDFYHDDFVTIIGERLLKDKKLIAEQEALKSKFIDYIAELKKSGLELDDFNKFLNILGSSQVIDILYRLHPDFKGLPVEYVKGILAEYIGNFLVVRNEFKLKDFKVVAEKLPLADLTTQERFYEALKNHCLQYYFSQSHHKHRGSSEIIYDYINYITDELGNVRNSWLDDVIEKVIMYYDSVLKDFHKPNGFVDRLDSDREFPDINQRINMKELADKKRLLIADEMGLGKSASVIMAKEQLGAQCALVVAPSNVVSTWKRYLSSKDANGYFETGKAPRVLEVENVGDIEGVTADEYDYILISQEKMTNRYTPILQKLDYDMLIIDEVHKIKNPNAVRTQGLVPLAEKIQGENKYIALLSGTPVPNKIRDVITLLRLLYPEKFAGTGDALLTQQIISGEIEELRDYLIPRMQMKNLEEGLEMPELKENIIELELSELEKEVYEVLLEEDEIPPGEKMKIMRQFLLNPELVEATPNFEGAKIKALREDIKKAFLECDKVVLFVNSYVEGIIRGDGSIIGQLNVPEDVTVKTIHGDNKGERAEIENQFQKTDDRMLLIVSGSTADVGVNFSRGQRVLMVNEPWTVADKNQEIARVYRFGLKEDLAVQTYIVRGTIEEGIHEYIIRKDNAIQKLLRGIPISEREQEMLLQDEKQGELDPDQEINPDLARYYFSSWDKLMQFFAYIKEQGEEKFNVFLEKYGTDYADAYMNMGSRSYQSNINRITGTLFSNFIENSKQDPRQVKILDIASGPEMLRRHIGDNLKKSVTSVDINQHHFLWEEIEEGKRIVGSWTELPSPNIAPNSIDYVNLALSLHYSSFAPSRQDYERIRVFQSINRVLKPGGKAVISMIYGMEMRDMAAFKKSAEVLGFKVVDDYTGDVESRNQFNSQIITLEKVANSMETPKEAVEKMGENYNGLKFDRTKKRLKDPRKVLNTFVLAGHGYIIELNEHDKAIFKEETEVTEEVKRLKGRYGDIKSIPAKEIIDNAFVRILAWDKYVLFKKLTSGPGVVIVK